MKRTNLVLREDVLEEATRLSGEKTYSRTVDRALEEFVQRRKAQPILTLAGSGLWTGDLPRDAARFGAPGSWSAALTLVDTSVWIASPPWLPSQACGPATSDTML
jgi:hypothetical protein